MSRMLLVGAAVLATMPVMGKGKYQNFKVSSYIRAQDVARMADEKGSVVIMKNNAPRYLLIEFSQAEAMQTASDEEVLSVSARLLAKNQVAYRELAK